MRQCIVFGDGLLDDKCPYNELYILAQTYKKEPKVCLLPTASGDNEGLIRYFEHLYSNYPCKTSHLKFFSPHTADIEGFLMEKDVIIVSGGQSKSMMAVWKGWGADKILRAAYENGTIMAGGSAGSVCWFDQCITDSIPGSLTVMDGLGFLPYSNCPHYLSNNRRRTYERFIMSGEIKEGYAADDYAGLHFIDEQFFRAVSGQPYSRTFRLSKQDGKLKQEQLPTKWLGLHKYQQEFIFDNYDNAENNECGLS